MKILLDFFCYITLHQIQCVKDMQSNMHFFKNYALFMWVKMHY